MRQYFPKNSDAIFKELFLTSYDTSDQNIEELPSPIKEASATTEDELLQLPLSRPASLSAFDSQEIFTVTKAQVKKQIFAIYKSKRDLCSSIKSHGRIVTQFDSFLTSVVLMLSVIFGIPFLGVKSPVSYFAAFGSFLFGFAFIFGGLVKSLFEALVFLFVTHAYDIGDTLLLDNTDMILVTKIDLLTTYARRLADNQSIAVPTSSMIPKTIYNVSRSGCQSFAMDIVIQAATAVDKIYSFRKAVTETLLIDSPSDFTGKSSISGFDIADGGKMRLKFSVEHASNFTDPLIKNKRNNKIKMTVKSVLESLEITYFSL